MGFVRFRMTPPIKDVAINPDEIFSLAPETMTPANDTQLFIDDTQRLLVLEPIDQVAEKLGPDFVRFAAASATIATLYVNRRLVTHVAPNPDVPNVCFVAGRGRKLAVKGSLDAVLAALAEPAKPVA
jgi:hypothetical protein